VVNALVNTSAAMGIANPGDRVINVPHAAALINKLIQVSTGFVFKETVPEKDPCTDCPFLRDCVGAKPPVKPWTPRCLKRDELGPPPEKYVEKLDSGKGQALADLFDELLTEKDNKVIVWGQFIPELDLIEEVIKKEGVGYVRVDGSNSAKAKRFEDQFNTDPDCRVYLGQVATGVSITLNSAQYMVYFSLPWNMEHYFQSLDRNHRLGQNKNVMIYRFLCKGVDQHIAKALGVKKVVADALVDEESSCRKVNRPITKVQEI
jgi:SNF2 family DNA or RNA helicase